MKIKQCRSCNSVKISKVFNIGLQALTGVFPKNKKDKIQSGSLNMVFCQNCKLLQLENSFNPKKMYGNNYGYMSSLNSSMVSHLKKKAENLTDIINLKKNDIICDIGSNDGTFLSFFSKKYKLIGIDPTIKKLSKYYRKDITKIPEFFSEKIIKKKTNKKIKMITSISMFYDIEKPVKFVNEVFNILDDEGIWHLEQSYMPAMIKNNSYDTICHEHLEYYSLTSIKYIFDRVGFKIIDLNFNNINGGSFSITVAKKKSKFKEDRDLIKWLINKEDLYNYNKIKTFKNFFKEIKKHKIAFKNLLLELKKNNKKVLGYGASTKGNVILQFCNINSKLLPYICDVNKFKYNRYTPGSKIKIISEKNAKKIKPDYYVVLPWHFKNFILNKESDYLKKGGKFIFPLPDIEII
tara:strand:- start:598 stop:1818 length:1221 start_codon:yes stop_codon:yes gene_type:complete